MWSAADLAYCEFWDVSANDFQIGEGDISGMMFAGASYYNSLVITAARAAIKGKRNHETIPDIKLTIASVLVLGAGGSGEYFWSISVSFRLGQMACTLYTCLIN